ncbi:MULTISPECIES: replication-relaxation family protein [Bacillus cereus group]|uniref:Replication-relaxation family protein n=2 Tax=Bacillus cereus group TaxID=86661 RepID=A0A9X7BU62_BACTU|nr:MULTISPECIES: replication-relaxation family protein [Bacillus cereus group]MBG9863521.1 hypothetical protein [Bacillus cereus]MBG9878610.1 hypothetical protein [Bacillus tropicus]MBG9921723.1 hypothetical protein [Bacillus tropicus]MBJ8353604.1 hypothetical protein [Bacillus mycoides]MCQ6289174.1 replication-relaxation family protein [Bacillus cereus]
MNKRDKAILNDLIRFRVMSRDQIITLHFSHLKNPVSNCNLVLKRLQDRNYIRPYKSFQPYVYAPYDSKIKDNSQKIFHFLSIVDTYIELTKYDTPSNVLIEPKFGQKGTIECDMFCLFRNTPFMIEIQRNQYSDKVMHSKIERYEQFYLSDIWQQFHWQRPNKKIFPIVLMITDTHYQITSEYIKVVQVPNIHSLINMFSPIEKSPISSQSSKGGIKIKIK